MRQASPRLGMETIRGKAWWKSCSSKAFGVFFSRKHKRVMELTPGGETPARTAMMLMAPASAPGVEVGAHCVL